MKGSEGEDTRHVPYCNILLPSTCTVFGSSHITSMSRNHRKAWIFVAFIDNVGDALTLKILKNDLVTILQRSLVESAADAGY
jgi:hypothetical protein